MISRIWTGLFAVMVAVGATSLSAQEIDPIDVYQDPNGIDLVSNNVSTSQLPTLSIPAAPELAFTDLADFVPLLEITTGDTSVEYDPNVYMVAAGRVASDQFAQCTSDEICFASNGTGGMLFNAEGGGNHPGNTSQPCIWCPAPAPMTPSEPGDVLGLGGVTYRAGNSGLMMTFILETEVSSGTLPQPVRKFLAEEINAPSGTDLHFEYDSLSVGGIIRHRPAVVTSTSGYQLRFTYFSNSDDPNWGILHKAEIVEATNPSTILASHTYFGNTVTDIAGRVFECVCQPDIYPIRPEQRGSRMKLPGETGYSFETYRQQGANVRTVTADGVTYTYTSSPDNSWVQPAGSPWPIGAIHDITITGPDGFYQFVDVTNIQATTGQYHPPRRRIESVTDSLGNTTTYQYTLDQRLSGVTYDEGNSVSVNYDIRGNLISRTDTPKPGSPATLLPISQSAAYPSTGCGIIGFSCYRPTSVTDGNGNVTQFTWDGWGNVLTELGAPDENNRRRKVINTWSGNTAINGETCPAFIQLGLPGPPRCTPRLLKEEVCETDINGYELTCGTANSYVREFTYFEATSLPLSVTAKDGAGNYPLTTTYTYDAAGRQLSMDGPLPGSEDAVYADYDELGRQIWEIGPQGEDGYRPATKKYFRDADDQVERVQTGYVAGSTTAASTPVFIDVISDVETDYNSRRLATETTVKSGTGTLFSVTQMNYDGLNRSDCTAVRMNLASLPADACTAGTPINGDEDRITRQHYDTESRVVRIEQGVDTILARDYATYTFTPNGQMASMTDARGYKASMMYDGFDRQTHWYFPDPAMTGAINSNDFEYYEYDANGNRTLLQKRDGSQIEYEYDNLNRVIRKTIPDTRLELHADHTRDVFYEYDIRGLQLHARFGSDSGVGTTSVYDTYGRMTSVTDNTSGTSRTLQSQYLPDGSRWELKYPDNQAFRSYYWPGGQFNHMTAPQGELLVDYNYTHRGELEEITRDATAPKQQWSYDAIGRMSSNFIDVPTSAFDVTWGYTRNPASQIRSETQTNDSFSWDGYVALDRSYATNGLNQYTSVSGQAYCYDKNGNLTADGDFVYLYDVENRLVEMRAPANTDCENLAYTGQIKAELRYDPMGRLYQVENFISGVGQGRVTMLYDGDALVAEYNASGTMLERYVHGPMPGVDDPIAEYSGSSVAAVNRTNLYTDSRGSIVLRAGATGGTPSINAYDEYGQPSTSNVGRFQYTGQVWLPELGMYYYKARIYSPALGRFMQTDPIGYEDDVNLYGYVGQDPINGADPTGNAAITTSFLASFLDNATPATFQARQENSKGVENAHNARGQRTRGSVSARAYVPGQVQARFNPNLRSHEGVRTSEAQNRGGRRGRQSEGHTISLHVGTSRSGLRDRAHGRGTGGGRKYRETSTFDSFDVAQGALTLAVSTNLNQINHQIRTQGGAGFIVVRARSLIPIGTVYNRRSDTFRRSSDIVYVLRYTPSNNTLNVITGYVE